MTFFDWLWVLAVTVFVAALMVNWGWALVAYKAWKKESR